MTKEECTVEENNKKIEENNQVIPPEKGEVYAAALMEIRNWVLEEIGFFDPTKTVSKTRQKKIKAEGHNKEREYMKEHGFNILYDRMVPWKW